MRALLTSLVAVLLATSALAQSSPGFVRGQTLTADELNAAFTTKQDTGVALQPFSSLTVNGASVLTGNLNVTGITSLTGSGNLTGTLTLGAGGVSSQALTMSGSGNLVVTLGSTGSIFNLKNASGALLQVNSSASPANFLTISNGSSGGNVVLSAGGTDLNVGMRLSGKGTGVILFTSPLQSSFLSAQNSGITWSGSTSNGATVNPVFITESHLGTSTSTGISLNWLSVGSDTIAATLNSSIVAWRFIHNVGTGAVGTRNTLHSELTQTGTTNARFFTAANFWTTVSLDNGGTGLKPGTAQGDVFGSNPKSAIIGGSNWSQVVGEEIDYSAEGSSTVMDAIGLQIVPLVNHRPANVFRNSIGLLIGAQDPVLGTITNGISFGREGGGIGITGAFITAIPDQNPSSLDYGVDWNEMTFNKYAWRTSGFSVDGVGNAQVGLGLVKPDSTGMVIDVSGGVATAVAISAGGTGWNVGDVLYFANGGRGHVATLSAGPGTAAATLVIDHYPFVASSGSLPANPVAATAQYDSTGTGLTLTLTWSTASALSLQPSGGAIKVGSGAAAANGSVATALSSVGPTGSHTTVQEWIKITNASGVVRYIPAF